MADTNAFAKLIPGFDFMQGLIQNAGSGLSGMGQWIAPTLDPEELEKRIRDLRTVQFWLEQNAKMIGATVQALEVQRMTLATLSTMNVPVEALRESMTLRMAEAPPSWAAPAPAPTPAPAAAPAPAPATEAPQTSPGSPAAGGAPAVDPMQWWGALTQQFSELAANALKDLPNPAATSAPAPPKARAKGPATSPAKTPRKAASKSPARKTQAAAGRRRTP